MSLLNDQTYPGVALTADQATGIGLGVALLTSPATSGQSAMLRADHAAIDQTSADGHWLTVKLAPRSTSSIFVEAGFCDADRTDYARLLFDTAVDTDSWRFETRDGTTQTAETPEIVPAADTFVTLDLMLTDGFASFSLDGADPSVLTSNLPATDLTPYVLVGTRTSSAKAAYYDFTTYWAGDGDTQDPS